MCHGVFDLMHIGHIRHFEEAKKFGDVLLVTITPDRFVNKGVHRPAFPQSLRAEAVAALEVVDFVAINPQPTAVDTIRLLSPNVFCKGSEYLSNQVDAESNLHPEIKAAEEVGAQIQYTNGVVFSSSSLLNSHIRTFPTKTEAWLDSFRARYSSKDIIESLDRLRSLKVLVVGEAIIDEYVSCDVIGKSTKDPVLAGKYTSTEAFAGGSLAVANHLAGFCERVGLITCLGEIERREAFVRGTLLPNVEATLLTKHRSPTIHKRRFVDAYTQNKLFELYVMKDKSLEAEDEAKLLDAFEAQLKNYDVVVVTDYGHGMLTPSSISALCESTRFLAVNAQSNAGNRGFNPISKYGRADYVCLAHHEVAMETRMREGDYKDLLTEVAQRIDCSRFTVTLGKSGSLHYEENRGFTEVPSFATRVADRVGAGDAVLALTSLLVAQDEAWDVVGFIGNVAGAQMVTELGNRVPVSRVPLAKHIISLLK